MRALIFAMALSGSTGVIAQTMNGMPAMPQPTLGLQTLLDNGDVTRVTNEIDVAVDRKDWKKARSFFAEDVTVDFTSLAPDTQPATIKSDDLIKKWAANLGPKKASFHIRGNHLVTIEGDKSRVVSNAYAWNRMEGNGDPLWEVWGNSTHELKRSPEGWKVTALTFVKTAERGNIWVKETPSPTE